MRAAKLGQVITLDCSVDANPAAQISLYRLGEAGRELLNRMSTIQTGFNQSHVGHSGRKISQFNPLLRNELSPSELASAIKTKGSQVLASATQKISYPLQVQRPEDFGFYVCLARNSGFPPALRHVLVGESGKSN
ncbi:unnamed protein product [Echinostoma caproni]|uniref:Ig-like domain-containing protein n=1 Tax=Echinostoma caproni TaxID=27848 RepID=A0A3P8LBM6_9TREM|nr:unnamed protein product [Echinostoma caproni]